MSVAIKPVNGRCPCHRCQFGRKHLRGASTDIAEWRERGGTRKVAKKRKRK